MYDPTNSQYRKVNCNKKHCSSLTELLTTCLQHPQLLTTLQIKCVPTNFANTSKCKLQFNDLQKKLDGSVYSILTPSFNSLFDCGTVFLSTLFLWLCDMDTEESNVSTFLYLVSQRISLISCTSISSCLELCGQKHDRRKVRTQLIKEHKLDTEFYGKLNFLCTYDCVDECSQPICTTCVNILRSYDDRQAKKKMNKNLQADVTPFTEDSLAGSSSHSPVPAHSTTTNTSTKHLPPSLEASIPGLGATNNSLSQAGDLTGATDYTTSVLPAATGSLYQHYGTDCDTDLLISKEERRKDVRVVPKQKDVDSLHESHRKDKTSSRKKPSSELQAKPSTKPSAQSGTLSNVDRPPRLEAATSGLGTTNNSGQHQAGDLTGATGYTTSVLPAATGSLYQHYGTDCDTDLLISKEERRKDVRVVPKEKDVDLLHESHRKDKVSSRKNPSSKLQAKPSAKPSAKHGASNVDRPPRFPRRACVVYKDEQYSLDAKLLSLPRATKYLVKVRTEISPGRFMAKLVLHCAR